MSQISCRILLGLVFTLPSARAAGESESPAALSPYKNAALPVKERVADLLGRMTLEEKARQLDMYRGCRTLLDPSQTLDENRPKPDAPLDPIRAEKEMGNLGIGSIHDLYPSPRLYNQIHWRPTE